MLGITQMMLGLFLKLGNALHFKSTVDLYFEAIPQIVFMTVLFGYMVFLIFFKWGTDWRAAKCVAARRVCVCVCVCGCVGVTAQPECRVCAAAAGGGCAARGSHVRMTSSGHTSATLPAFILHSCVVFLVCPSRHLRAPNHPPRHLTLIAAPALLRRSSTS